MKDYTSKAIELTEDIGSRDADLGMVIEEIHYDPEQITAEGIEQLKEIRQLIMKANRIAKKIKY
jgi:hypothetical protein